MSKSKNTNMPIQTLALGGLMAAMVCVATSFFKLPVPITQGYIHLGDAFVLVSAAILGPVGVAAAALLAVRILHLKCRTGQQLFILLQFQCPVDIVADAAHSLHSG